MARPFPREQLQPALLDRLSDDLTSAVGELSSKRRILEGLLDEAGRTALGRLLDDETLATRSLRAGDLVAFKDRDEETRTLVGRVIELEQARRLELRRAYAVTMDQLRASVLRELNQLLNTERLEDLQLETSEGLMTLLDGLPHVRESIVNYGIPSLAGRIRTPSDYEGLARAIEQAIRRYEPRLAAVKVSYEGAQGNSLEMIKSPVVLIIEGELWGYPLTEQLRLRTVLDLEEGKAHVEGAPESRAA